MAQATRLVRTQLCVGRTTVHFHEEGNLKPSLAPGGPSDGVVAWVWARPPACAALAHRPSACRGAREDLEAAMVHPHGQLPLLLRIHDGKRGQWPAPSRPPQQGPAGSP